MDYLRMKWAGWLVTAGLWVATLAPGFARGQGNQGLFVGARPLGMGGAFVAVADDGNTIRWNPAGLPGLRRHEITFMYSNLYDLDILNSYLAYVYPIGDQFSVGVDWHHVGFNDDELGFARNGVNLSMGFQPFRMVAVGANFKYVSNDMSLDGTSYGKSTGTGWDFGLLFSPLMAVRAGLSVYDIGGTSVTYDNRVTETVSGQRIRFGLAWIPFEGLTLAADADDRWHVGTEYWVSGILGIRAGVERDRQVVDGVLSPVIPSAGLSLRYRFIRVDYGYEDNPLLFPTHRISLSLLFRPALVTIKSAAIHHAPLFRSLYHYYEDRTFAHVTLKNSSDRDLPVKVSLFVPTMMESPHEEQLILPAKELEEFPLGVSFADDILQLPRAAFDNLVQPEIKVTYSQERREKSAMQKLDRTYVLGRGKISWDEPRRIAGFVTAEDPAVDRFARFHVQYYDPILTNYLTRSNLGKAMVLFDALGAYGLTYSPDLQTPFIQISKDRTAFDMVKYPSELLRTKVGDCDDLTVLYGSLLENLGIATQFLDVFAPGEGHIFLMFDSGLTPDDVNSFFLEDHEVAILDGRVWIPVETTLVGAPFFLAWQQGAFEYHRRKEEGLMNVVDIRKSQETFRPESFETVEPSLSEDPGISELLKADLAQYGLWLQQLVFHQIGDLNTAEDYYGAGALYLNFSRLTEAMEMFEGSLDMQPDFADALNALGVVYTRLGDYERALDNYNRALELYPEHPGFYLNIAITLFLQGNKMAAREKYEEVKRKHPQFAGELDLLFGLKKAEEKEPISGFASRPEKLIEFEVIQELDEELRPSITKSVRQEKGIAGLTEIEVMKAYRKRRARSDNSVGLEYARRGKLELAADYFGKANRTDPGETEYLANLAVSHYLLEKYDLALAEYGEAVKRNPELVPQLKFIESRGKEKSTIKRFE